MRRPFLEAPPPLVVDLRRRHVPMAEQFLDLDDVHPGIEEQRRRGRPQRMRRVDACLTFFAVPSAAVTSSSRIDEGSLRGSPGPGCTS